MGALQKLGAEAGRGAVRFPMRDDQGGVTGWKVRRPDGKPIKAKAGPTKSWTEAGSKNGLLWHLADDHDGAVIVTEGEANAAAILSAAWPSVVATPGATPGRKAFKMLSALCAGRAVVLTPDPDAAGTEWRGAAGRALASAQCQIRYIVPEPDRDIDETLRGADDREGALRQMVENAIPWRDPEPTDESDPAAKYWQRNPTGRVGFKPALLGDEFIAHHTFSYCSATGEVMVFDPRGVWLPLSKSYLHSLVANALGAEFRTNHAEEVYGYLRARFGDVEGLLEVAPADCLNFENGLLRCDDWQLIEHTPDVLSFNQLPVHYDPAATTMPCWRQVLADALDSDEDRNLLQELFGYAIAPHQYSKKGFVLVGPSNTGKSLALRVLSRLVGEVNLSAIPIQKLGERFTAAGLFRKLANISADLPARKVEDSSVFKLLTGNDAIHGEHKYGETFQFKSAATPIFSCNELPYTDDRSSAYFDRWVILRFGNVVPKSAQVPDLDEIIWQAEAEAVTAWAVEGLKRLKARKWQFHETSSVLEMRSEYRKHADSVFGFVSDVCELKPDESETVSDLFNAYGEYCQSEGISRAVARKTFTRRLREEFGLAPRQKVRQRGFAGIHIMSDFEQSGRLEKSDA